MDANNSKLGFVITGLLLAILMGSMDNTILATAMGTIVGDLGGLDKFIWVTSAYMIAELAGMPIFGKLSDMYGRKRFFIFGLIVFMGGSILCSTAQDIVQLSIYRAIQGIGGGALIPIAFTIVYDVFPPEKRGKITGLLGAAFGLSSIFGPLLGAYVTDYMDWRWVFYINLPLGVLAFVLIQSFYKESISHENQKIDWWGALTLVGAVVSLMFALEFGGHQYKWTSGMILGLLGTFVVLFIGFLYAETRAADPIVSFQMFKDRLFTTSNLVTFFNGTAFIVAIVYLPIYIQGVLGASASSSGLLLIPMMLGTVISAMLGGGVAMKFSYRSIMLVSAVIFLISFYLLGTMTPDTSRLVVTFYMIIAGLGTGASFSVLSMSAIHHLDANKRGAANSTVSFLRSIGMTIGITVFGILQRNSFADKMGSVFAGQQEGVSEHARELLQPDKRISMPGPLLEKITAVLSSSITDTFMWGLIPAALTLAAAILMTGDKLSNAVKDEH